MVAASQRFTRQRACPVCRGYDQAPRGIGDRCWGFLSEDGAYAHCTRLEKAGQLELTDGSETYAHRMQGECNCGVEHEPRHSASNGAFPRRRIVATYDFTDADGKLLFQEVKYSPKGFSQRRPDGQGDWVWNLKGVQLVLHRLPELIAADPAEPVYIIEGPKDADRLAAAGLVATTNPMGAKKWRVEYNEPLRGRDVVILGDNDKDGREHVQIVARSLSGIAASIKIIEFPELPEHGDVSDWLDARHAIEELKALAAAAPEWEPEQQTEEQPSVTAHVGEATGEHLTDLGNARRLVARHGPEMHFPHQWHRWLTYDGRRWAVDDTADILRRAKDTVGSIYIEAGEATDPTARKALADHAKRSESEAHIKAMISLAESEPGIPVRPDELDTDPMLFNVDNGTLNLRTGELQPHTPDDLITKIAQVAFDPDAEAPIWDAFLERVLPDANVRAFLQRLIGYSMTGLTTEQIIAFLIGNGANGKSTLLEVLLALFGDYGRTAAPGMLLTGRSDRHPTELADLHGARFVSTVEVGEGRRLKEDLIKQLTGGDTIKARRMHENFWEFTPTHQLFVAANLKPEVRGTDLAIWRRIVVVPFDVTIPPTEQDKNLTQKVRAQLPGILAWAVRGCLEWQHDGLGAPPEVLKATASYRAEEDTLGAFIEDECTLSDNAKATAKALYAAYREWCRTHGEEPVTQKAFGLQLAERGLTAARGRGTRWWKGIGLAAEPGLNDGREQGS